MASVPRSAEDGGSAGRGGRSPRPRGSAPLRHPWRTGADLSRRPCRSPQSSSREDALRTTQESAAGKVRFCSRNDPSPALVKNSFEWRVGGLGGRGVSLSLSLFSLSLSLSPCPPSSYVAQSRRTRVHRVTVVLRHFVTPPANRCRTGVAPRPADGYNHRIQAMDGALLRSNPKGRLVHEGIGRGRSGAYRDRPRPSSPPSPFVPDPPKPEQASTAVPASNRTEDPNP